MATMRIMIAEDHALFGDLLELFFVSKNYIVYRSIDYEELLDFSKTSDGQLVHIVLLDLMMPGFRGCASLEEVSKAFSSAHVVALTSVPPVEFARQAIQAGFSGYLQKTIQLKKIPIVLDLIMAGEVFVDSQTRLQESNDTNETLSFIEMRVISLLSQGLSNKEIAYAINETETKVKSINRTLSRKFNVKNRTQLALKATREKLFIPGREFYN